MHSSDAGLFGPGSATWRIHRENAIMLGGGRALILQVAHPLVGAGVAEHSRYLTDRWGRLTHTLAAMRQLIYGDAQTAQRSADRIRRAHARVQGVVAEGSAAGSAYDATDPELILWVWATLVDTALLTYQRFVRPLPDWEAERYYQEQKRWAIACGMPDDYCPATLPDFADYVSDTVKRTLEPTEAARHLAEIALNPIGLPRFANPLLGIARLPTVGLLPPTLRAPLNLRWTAAHEQALLLLALISRRTVPVLPTRLRHVPSARLAAERARTRGPQPCP
jgi:uncharacterized protein (DUF2236 family)